MRPVTAGFRKAFPDLQVTVGNLIGEGVRVTAHWVVRGNHQGNFQGILPTVKQISIQGINISRFEGGKIVEDRAKIDAPGKSSINESGAVADYGRVSGLLARTGLCRHA